MHSIPIHVRMATCSAMRDIFVLIKMFGLGINVSSVLLRDIVVGKVWLLNFVVLLVCGAGCLEAEKTPVVQTGGNGGRVDSAAGRIDYLQKENPPALRSVTKWENEYGPGIKLVTEHYEIFTTFLEPLMLRQLPGFMESAYRAYNGQLPEAIETKAKFTIYVFAERKQWEDFTEGFAGRNAVILKKIKAGAYCMNGSCVVYNIGREQTLSVLGHEGWHQFNSRHFKFRLPSWLNEGIAMLFEASRYDKGLFYFEPGRNLRRLGALRKTLIDDRMMPLQELMGLNPGEVLATKETEDVTAFYGQSYALVRFLREEEFGKRLGNYQQLLLGSVEGTWPLGPVAAKIAADRNIPMSTRWNRVVGPKLFEHYVSDDFDQIEREYLAFCKKIVYRIRLKKAAHE